MSLPSNKNTEETTVREKNPKNVLQEYCHKLYHRHPNYNTIKDVNGNWVCKVAVVGFTDTVEASSKWSKKEAEKEAAVLLYNKIHEEMGDDKTENKVDSKEKVVEDGLTNMLNMIGNFFNNGAGSSAGAEENKFDMSKVLASLLPNSKTSSQPDPTRPNPLLSYQYPTPSSYLPTTQPSTTQTQPSTTQTQPSTTQTQPSTTQTQPSFIAPNLMDMFQRMMFPSQTSSQPPFQPPFFQRVPQPPPIPSQPPLQRVSNPYSFLGSQLPSQANYVPVPMRAPFILDNPELFLSGMSVMSYVSPMDADFLDYLHLIIKPDTSVSFGDIASDITINIHTPENITDEEDTLIVRHTTHQGKLKVLITYHIFDKYKDLAKSVFTEIFNKEFPDLVI